MTQKQRIFALETQHLIRDKYAGDASRVTAEDIRRLATGEPLAYIIGWVPFCGTTIFLDSKPLIPRTETEWWTEQCITAMKTHEGPLQVLDLCSGSGCIGIAILAAIPDAQVTFADITDTHIRDIRTSLTASNIDPSRAAFATGNVWGALPTSIQFNYIVTNPPYIPTNRQLDSSVTDYEPSLALYAGEDGLTVITSIVSGARQWLTPGGEIWLECDVSHAQNVFTLFTRAGATAKIMHDQYNRPRLVVASWI